ncbi:MAG: TIGR04388 family protein, partial [Leptospirales bacterium]
RKGLGQFRDLARKISVAESEARQNELIEAASLQRDIEIAEFNYATAENLREAYMVSMEPRPRVNETFLNRADQGVPDYASFAKAAQSIGETLSGALNVAVVEDLNDKANKEQKNATDSLKAMLERSAEISDKDLDDALEKRREEYLEDQAKKPWKYVEPFDAAKERQQIKDSFQEQIDREQWTNVTVSSTGVITATRRIAKGNVTLRAGEDATESESYDVEYEEQTINFQGAGAIRLGETAGLFSEEFDTGKANQNFYDDLDAFAEAFNEQVVGLTDLTSQANKSLSARWSGAQKNIQNQVKIANTAASLVQGIAGGGFNFAQWAQGVVNGEVSQIFEEAFNVPAGLLVNMANGMNLGKAASKWLESAAYDFLEQATGVQGMAAFAREAIDKINKNARVGRMRDQAMGKNLSTSDFTNSLKGAAAGGVVPGGQLLAGANTLQSFAEFGAAGGRYLAHEFEHSQFGKTVLDAPFKITKVMSDAFMMPPLPFTSYESAKGFVQDSMDYARGSDRKAIRARMDERLEEYADRAKDQGSLKKLTSIKPLSLLGDYVGAVLSPITQGLGKPNVPASQTTLQMRETMGNTVANALNLPATMTRMMMFEGANLDEAMTAQAFANIEAAVGIPGIADHYQRALERYHFKQRKDAAGGMRPEDYLTMGSTYLWRNAEYNKDLGVGLQVAETVGGIVLNTVGNIIPGVGTGIWLAYNALKQSYMGSLKGGTRGAIAGYMSAGLTAFTSQFGVNAGVSYSYEDGWGGQVGVTLPIGDTSLSGSAGINFQEG